MADPQTAQAATARFEHVVDCLEAVRDWHTVVARLREGGQATLDGVWGSACALAAAALVRHAPGPLLVVAPHASQIDDLVDELALFGVPGCLAFPMAEAGAADEIAEIADEAAAQRLRVLKRLLCGDSPPAVVASIQALLQAAPDREVLERHTRRIAVGQTLDPEELARWLVEHGFQHQSAVRLPGEFSMRGGIFDLFAPEWFEPLRIELFGDEVESMRRFDVETQRSTARLDHVELTVASAQQPADGQLTDYLPNGSWVLMIEPGMLEEEGRQFLRRDSQSTSRWTVRDVMQRLMALPSVACDPLSGGAFETVCHVQVESVERFSGDVARVREELETAAGNDRVWVVCEAEGEIERLQELLGTSRVATEGRLQWCVGRLRNGFRLASGGVVLLSTAELFQRPDTVRLARRRRGHAIDSFLDLREGDLVVHVGHGIARYRGIQLIQRGDQQEEHLELEFDGGTKLFVPATRIDLVQKYIGGGRARPKLARLGGRSWLRQKQMAEAAVLDLAQEMLELQAARATRPGIAFPADSPWQHEFDAAFPYVETPDQWEAITAIKRDMCQPQPMDRLICGDVGYGKTELAMRAAFKAVDAGYQVAVLVPTTVLAEQHYRTFTSRMAEYPFEIRLLSRYLTRSQQAHVIESLADGTTDIVIGTHRLAQRDVHFQNLGLIIIDEEQRFGVEVKERLKALRQIVDVLTLSATPIPRTLHMALLGLRDISNLETPPEERMAVETHVTRWNDDLIRRAVLRELNREGQIFFIHNRVRDIEVVARRLRQVVPEASLAIGHGQMNEHELEQVMRGFVEHRFDLLLATTIVENGLDIPNANTIFINEADRYGLADLHQLRGRVGRYKHRAYCYLLVDPAKVVTPDAAKRLRAIEEYSHMGAGFAIAMRDLEIRGAGNILGTAQSGHIAAVGYELYCQLLEKTVRELKSLPPKRVIDVEIDLPGQAFLPRDYVPDQRAKIDLYRRLSWTTETAQLDELRDELVDRFGPPPPEVERLLLLARLRIWAQALHLRAIRREDDYLVLHYWSPQHIERLQARSGNRLRILPEERSAYLPLSSGNGRHDGRKGRGSKNLTSADQSSRESAVAGRILQELESLLRPE